MKKATKMLALLLAAVCLLSFAACGSKKGENEAGGAVTYGEVTGKVYTNEFLGLQITAPTGWDFLSQEDMRQLTQDVQEAFPDVEAFEKSESAEKIVMYMWDTTKNGQNSVNLTLGKGGIFASLEQTVEASKRDLKTAYEQMGAATVEYGTEEEITLGGKQFVYLPVTGSISGISFAQYVYFAKYGSYVCVLAASDFTGVGRTTFESMLSAYAK